MTKVTQLFSLNSIQIRSRS